MSRSSSLLVGFLAFTIGVAFVSSSYSQEERQGGRRGGGGGRFGGGGFRFGGGMFGGGGNELSLLRIPAIQKELGLSGDDKDRADQLAEDLQAEQRETMQKLGIDFGALRDMPQDEREKKMKEMSDAQAKVAAKYQAKVDEMLKPEQSKRLKQIALQTQGAQALGAENVAKDLGLSDDQKKDIAKIQEDAMASMRRGFGRGQEQGQGQEDLQARMEEMRKAGEERDAKLLAVLTDDQRKKFDELKGEAFDVASLRRGPGGFGGGRGGAGGRRGGRGGEGGGRERPPM